MNNLQEMLEVIDENDNVIGLESREGIHKKELLHRDVHVWFVTPHSEIIFQHRSPTKDLLPDKLDSTVGGHVEIGDSYEKSAIKECFEETGISINSKELFFITKRKNTAINNRNGELHQTIGIHYAYLFKGDPADLIIENGKADGFEYWDIDKLESLSDKEKERFIPAWASSEAVSLYNEIIKTVIR